MERHEDILRIVNEELPSSAHAHGIEHAKRVYRLCRKLSREDVDEDVLLPAALLHDIARGEEDHDESGEIDHAELGAEKAESILDEQGFDRSRIRKIKHCIKSHRFRSGLKSETLEAKILSDTDKLDAIGAVGVARMFMLAGEFGERLFREVDVEMYRKENLNEDGRVKKITKHSPNLEYELKLKKIPEKLYTEEAKDIAEERIEWMDTYFSRLKEEIEAKK